MGAKVCRPRRYVWFDSEFTSLELERARLMQVAAIVTGPDLRRVLPPGDDLVLTVRLPPGHRASPWVRQHLAGALRASRRPGAVPVATADARLAALVDRVAGPPAKKPEDRPVLAGNSVHTDWWLVRRWLPAFAARLHYRHLDVSGLKLLWLDRGGAPFPKDDATVLRRGFPGWTGCGGEHDALYDVQASIAELAYYRDRLLRRPRPARGSEVRRP